MGFDSVYNFAAGIVWGCQIDGDLVGGALNGESSELGQFLGYRVPCGHKDSQVLVFLYFDLRFFVFVVGEGSSSTHRRHELGRSQGGQDKASLRSQDDLVALKSGSEASGGCRLVERRVLPPIHKRPTFRIRLRRHGGKR